MSAVIADVPTAEVRKCKIEEVLSVSFIELIGLAPRNPFVRAIILAQTGKMPAPECETFDQIKDWIETTCDRKVRSPDRQMDGNGISITVEFSETECGRASYTVATTGREEFYLEPDDLLAIVEEAINNGLDLDEVVQTISKKIHEEAWSQCVPNMNDYGDYEYENHEAGDTEDSSESFSTVQIRERVMAFLRNNHPALAHQL